VEHVQSDVEQGKKYYTQNAKRTISHQYVLEIQIKKFTSKIITNANRATIT
jgi:hypothetical protein